MDCGRYHKKMVHNKVFERLKMLISCITIIYLAFIRFQVCVVIDMTFLHVEPEVLLVFRINFSNNRRWGHEKVIRPSYLENYELRRYFNYLSKGYKRT